MASRTYAPTLLALLRTTCKYIARNREYLIDRLGMSEGQVALLDAVVTACEALTDFLKGEISTGD